MVLIPVGLGMLSWSMQKNNQGLVDAFMVVCGVGVGMTFGPLAIHARFSQPDDRIAVVIGLNLFVSFFPINNLEGGKAN